MKNVVEVVIVGGVRFKTVTSRRSFEFVCVVWWAWSLTAYATFYCARGRIRFDCACVLLSTVGEYQCEVKNNHLDLINTLNSV